MGDLFKGKENETTKFWGSGPQKGDLKVQSPKVWTSIFRTKELGTIIDFS